MSSRLFTVKLGMADPSDHLLNSNSMQVGCAASAYSAEEALAQAQLVDLPHNGGSVLPLAAHGFLVGLLVIEGFSAQEPPVSQTPGMCTHSLCSGW